MRTILRQFIIGTCLLGPGCQFVCHIGRNLVHEPLMACDEKQLKHRNHKLGKQAWNEMVQQHGECFSCDYRSGFVDGFADYLNYGGCSSSSCGNEAGTPAPKGCDGYRCDANSCCPRGNFTEYPICRTLPPERYKRKKYATPEGCQAVEEWFTGFRHGAATAIASGLRSVQVIPVQCPPKFGLDDGGVIEPAMQRAGGVTAPVKETSPPMPPTDEITKPSAETLPPPRPAGDADPKPPVLPPPPE